MRPRLEKYAEQRGRNGKDRLPFPFLHGPFFVDYTAPPTQHDV